jgi:glycosyltransferase involved in cell wall biosynthesis
MINNNIHISIVSPVYRAENIVEELVKQIIESVSTITPDFEIILVNDCSPDNSWLKITEEATKDNRVKGINFSRNFGQHYAITAGLDNAKGDWVVILDCDLQDNPNEIPNLYKEAILGYDIVLGRRIIRKDTFFKITLSRLFYSFLSYLTDSKIDHTIGSFRILSKSVVEQFKQMRESSRYFGAMINWLGYKVGYIELTHEERYEGKSTYNFKSALRLALNGVLSFSDKPLRLTIKFGFYIVMLSIIFIFYKIIHVILYGTSVIGWSSLIASIFFSTGIIISILGIIGLYIGRIFEQVKQRPLYIISETTKTLCNE